MRRLHFAGLVLTLAAAIHVDWHLARPAHHRLSLSWPHHWLFAVAVFALVGWVIARRWPRAPGRAAAGIVVGAVLLAQGIEPVLEQAVYGHELGYPNDPERWSAFLVCVGAGLPALLATLVLCRPRTRKHDSAAPAS